MLQESRIVPDKAQGSYNAEKCQLDAVSSDPGAFFGKGSDRRDCQETFRGQEGKGIGVSMHIDLFKHEDNWQDIKDSAMNTINKTTGRYPDSEWKRRLILSEHSPIRRMRFYWRWKDLKSWVSVHMVRHKIGIEHWVSTQRSDRTGVDRDELPQGALVNHACEADAQALINISRKRLCNCASPETREAWQLVKEQIAGTEPELASCMVRECIYRGFCPEMFSCGYHKTEEFQQELAEYRKGINE